MTRRDLAWRAGGVALFIVGCGVNLLGRAGGLETAVTGPLAFMAAVLGIVLLIQGRRVPNFWKIERSRHRELPAAIHQRRCRSRAAHRPADRSR